MAASVPQSKLPLALVERWTGPVADRKCIPVDDRAGHVHAVHGMAVADGAVRDRASYRACHAFRPCDLRAPGKDERLPPPRSRCCSSWSLRSSSVCGAFHRALVVVGLPRSRYLLFHVSINGGHRYVFGEG